MIARAIKSSKGKFEKGIRSRLCRNEGQNQSIQRWKKKNSVKGDDMTQTSFGRKIHVCGFEAIYRNGVHDARAVSVQEGKVNAKSEEERAR